MIYHIVKKGTEYRGLPYVGRVTDYLRIEYFKLEVAREAVEEMRKRTLIDWSIYDVTSKTLVES